MKIFIYKSIITFVLIFLFYQITIGAKVREIESKVNNFTSEENIEFFKDKIRQEIKNGLEKENYLNKEDAKLLSDFINKIKLELIAK
tara:strand:- start:1255 stop:1515 length:261 start_codon:yes stop_codon:yes gene_type:complete